MKPLLLVILFALCPALENSWRVRGQSSSEAASRTARPNNARLRQKTFDVVWRTVKEKYFDQTFGGVDWEKVRERYAPQVAAVRTDEEFYDLLNKMLGELRVSHLAVYPPEAVESSSEPPGVVGLDFRRLNNLVVITRVIPNSPAARAGLRPGFIIKKIDDAPVENQERSEIRQAIGGRPRTKVRLTVLDDKDREREVTLERELLQTDADRYGDVGLYARFESERLEGGIGYIRFTQFIPSLNKKIRAAVTSMTDAPGLVIDLRGNGGGEDEVGIKLAGLLFDKRTVLMITKTRKGDDDYYQARPEKKAFLGPVVILLDELSASASEQFAAGMQESGRAFIIGQRSAGDDLDADLKKLPTGAYLLYAYGQPRTPKGVIIEGRGVIPDAEVELSREALLRGTDSQLSAALDYIRKHALQTKSASTTGKRRLFDTRSELIPTPKLAEHSSAVFNAPAGSFD